MDSGIASAFSYYVYLFGLIMIIKFDTNNYILDPKMYNWPFPISLAMIHMSFCSSVSFILIWVVRLVDTPSWSPKLYVSSVVPIGALYSLSLWFSNSVNMYLSVASVQMLRVLLPLIVYCIGILLKKETFKSSVMTDMLTIGILFGEVPFDAFKSTQLALIQILVTSKGISLNPITSLHYVVPCCLVFLLIPWTFVELPVLMKYSSSFNIDFFAFGTNLLFAFALNLAVFLLVGNMSQLTINVAGVLKDWFLIALSWSVIRNTVTTVNLIGYTIAFSGVVYYNYVKLHVKVAEPQVDEEMWMLSQDERLEERQQEI